MFQRLNDARAVDAAGDQATGGGDFFPDFLHRVRRAGGHAGVGGIEHFHVVVAVTHGETTVRGKPVQPRDFSQAAALLEIPVAEAQVDRVPLPCQVRLGGDKRRDVRDDPLHFLLGAGNQARGFAVLHRWRWPIGVVIVLYKLQDEYVTHVGNIDRTDGIEELLRRLSGQ